jgi:hypothetical protein
MKAMITTQGLLLAMAFTAILWSGCTDVAIHTATSPAFGHYRTYAFGPAEGPPSTYVTSARTAEVQRRLQPLITAALTERGYELGVGKVDFFVVYGSGRRNVAFREQSEVGNDWLPDDESADFVEGALVIDAIDATTKRTVWHGASRAQIDPDRIDDQVLSESVTALIQSFPQGPRPRSGLVQALGGRMSNRFGG